MSKLTIQCEYCKKTVKVFPYEKDKRKYCSNKCRGLDKRERTIGYCETCGVEIVIRLSDLKRKYCSKKCSGIGHSGDSNPAKKPGVGKKISISKQGTKNSMFGNHNTKEANGHLFDCSCCVCKNKRGEFVVGVNRGGRIDKPNKEEKKLIEILNTILPGEYKYVGDGSFWIKVGNKNVNPDFINVKGQKKIIELFGNFWHGEKRTGRTKIEEEQQRTVLFDRCGYKPLVIWGKELKDIGKLKYRLELFNSQDW
jgi:endogenous inhibitor of DNA gyrase (YacG/DUF329 family)